MRATGTDGTGVPKFPPMFPPNVVDRGETVSFSVILAGNFEVKQSSNGERESRTKPTKKALSEDDSDKASKVGATVPTLNRNVSKLRASSAL